MPPRHNLSRARIVDAAAGVADRVGLERVSMRNVGAALDVEAMSLYHHIPNKNALLDALAEWAFTQITLPEPATPWREAMRIRADSARDMLRLHPWALGMLESRPTPSAALMQHHERILHILRSQGFSARLATHAFSTLDAFIYGFALTEARLPFSSETNDAESEGKAVSAEASFAEHNAPDPALYPHLAHTLGELFANENYRFSDEFRDGVDLILDGLQQRLALTQD